MPCHDHTSKGQRKEHNLSNLREFHLQELMLEISDYGMLYYINSNKGNFIKQLNFNGLPADWIHPLQQSTSFTYY